MDMLNKEKFKKDMAAFSFKQHQDVLTYLAHLKAKGWTIDDAREWIKREREKRVKLSMASKKQQKKALAALPKCPECESPLQILPVNTGPGDRTGDDSKSMKLCMNKECMHTQYSTKTVQEQIKELSKK